MSKEITASSGGFTGTIIVSSKVERDEYYSVMEALRRERSNLYAARNAGEISYSEYQDKSAVISLLASELYTEYAGDTLPTVQWQQE